MILIFNTKQECLDRNHEIALAQGCSDTTLYWFEMLTDGNNWGFVVPDSEQGKLTEQECSNLVELDRQLWKR